MAINNSKAEDKKEAAIFSKYLENRTVLIADPNASSRSGLFSIFRDLGAKPSQLTMVNTFSAAEQFINEKKPHIVIAEYDLGKRCGVELLQNQRTQRPKETKECLFVVVTGNTSQSAVARAAEEDIDAYVLKPFTAQGVRKTLLKAALLKIKPPQYVTSIDEGKALLESGKLEEAEEKFKHAATLDPAPSLAHYYIGQVRFMKKIMAESKSSYSKGLEYNKIHYKCMVGLYELLQTQQQHSQAYEVVKRLSQYFPANPKRLSEVLRLAITTGQYDDIEKYYAVFTNIDERNETLIKYVCAALVVCGKYYLQNNLGHTRAIQLFQKASATGTGRANIIKEIVTALIDNNLHKEAKSFLDKYPPEGQSSSEYLVLKFMIANLDSPLSMVIAQGRELIQKGVQDIGLYRQMIRRSLEGGLQQAAETLCYDAIKIWPDKADEFNKFLGK